MKLKFPRKNNIKTFFWYSPSKTEILLLNVHYIGCPSQKNISKIQVTLGKKYISNRLLNNSGGKKKVFFALCFLNSEFEIAKNKF